MTAPSSTSLAWFSRRKFDLRGPFTVKTWHLSGAIVLVGVYQNLSVNGFPAPYDLTGRACPSSDYWSIIEDELKWRTPSPWNQRDKVTNDCSIGCGSWNRKRS